MPWIREGKCVYKENPDGSKGENIGCSDTVEEAKKHLEALYVNASDKEKFMEKAKPVKKTIVDHILSMVKKPEPPKPPPSAHGIKNPPLRGEEPYEPNSRNYAQKPDEHPMPGRNNKQPAPRDTKPSPPKDEPGKPKMDKPVPGKPMPNMNKKPGRIFVRKEILFTKENDRIRWFCDFTNNFRDRDNPAEILASVAHERFVKEVDEGQWPMPVLRWWHIDGTDFGKADWLAYDKDNGITMASGLIDKGKEAIAEAIENYPETIGVSHGMIPALLERDSKDKSIITRYVTQEISFLPARAAANPLTQMTIGKEINMALSQDKLESLRKLPFTEDQIKEIEERNAQKAADQKSAGVESKEVSDPPAPEEPKEEPVEEPKEEPITRKEIADAVVEAVTAAVKPLQMQINQQGKLISDFQTKAAEEAKKELSATPTASLGAMIMKSFSVIGDKSTAIDGRSSLVKSAPKEAEDENNSSVPFNFTKMINVH